MLPGLTYPGKRYVDWLLVDPVGLPIDEVRRIRDQIRTNVTEMLPGLEVPPAACVARARSRNADPEYKLGPRS